MITPINIFIYFFFVFGVTYLVRHTSGLGDCFLKLRCLLGQKHKVTYETAMDKKGEYVSLIKDRVEIRVPEYAPWYTKLIDCFWCTSTWVSGITILFYHPIPWNMKFMVWFASVGFAGMIYTFMQNGEK